MSDTTPFKYDIEDILPLSAKNPIRISGNAETKNVKGLTYKVHEKVVTIGE